MFLQDRTDTETGIMTFADTDSHVRRDTFAHSPQGLRTFRAGGFLVPGDIEFSQAFGHLHGYPVIQHGMCLDHDVELRAYGIADGLRYIESKVLLCGRQGQVGGQVFTIEIVCVCERVELQAGKAGFFYFQCLLGVILCVVSAAGKPVVGIQQYIFPVGSPQ